MSLFFCVLHLFYLFSLTHFFDEAGPRVRTFLASANQAVGVISPDR